VPSRITQPACSQTDETLHEHREEALRQQFDAPNHPVISIIHAL
jgi:hypothetical protein